MIGQQFGRYTIQSELGRGGMATVYLAYDTERQHDVALKVLPRTFMHDPTFRDRFEREARTIMQLEHDAIVPVYDFGAVAEQPYIAMRLMRGGSLQDRLKQGPLPLPEAETIMRRICSALDKAHARGIVHRDLKPGNILFDDEGVSYLADFGIARLVEGTQTVTMIGTPQYMAPEQAHGLPLDARTDVYQMGVVLFEMLTGRIPFEAPTPAALMFQHAHTPAPPVRDFNANLPPAIDDVLKLALAKDKSERLQRAGALATAFSGALRGAPVLQRDVPTYVEPALAGPSVKPAQPLEEARERRKVPPWMTLIGVIALLALIGGGYALSQRGGATLRPGVTTPTLMVPVLADGGVTGTAVAVVDGGEEMDSAETPTPEPSSTPQPSTTPMPTDTPTPLPTNTPLPTPTWTPLPTVTPTWTPLPTLTPTPVPTVCSYAAWSAFSGLWQANQAALGCATGSAAATVYMATEDFQRGRMIWRSTNDRIYVIYNSGSWASYADIWVEGDPEFSCGTQQSPPTPKRGFGKIWCTNPSVQSGLGSATNGEWGADGSVQPFANGTILRASDGRTYVLLDNGTWR